MVKKLLFLVCLIFFVSCGSKKSTLTGNKIREKELVSKEKYRADLRKIEENKRKAENSRAVTSASKDSQVLEATSSVRVTEDIIKDYIVTYSEIAKNNMATHGIPASITLAQGVLESGSGQGTLSRNANNHFGIKCHTEWEGPSVRHTDDAPDECFRKYDSPDESYRDHSLFLVTRSRYGDLFKLPRDDYKGWAHGLKKAGYATDPKYGDKLISLIERYSLNKYDIEVLKELGIDRMPVVEEVIITDTPAKKNNTANNSRNTHVVKKGDTLYSISKKYNTSVAKVQKLNNMSGTALSIGQILKIK